MRKENKPYIKKKPTISRLRALSEMIQRYLKGEGLPPPPTTSPLVYLNTMINNIDLGPEGLMVVEPTLNYKPAYDKARDEALGIKQEFLGLPKLPDCELEPTTGLRELLEWCADSIGKITVEDEPKQPSGEVGDEEKPAETGKRAERIFIAIFLSLLIVCLFLLSVRFLPLTPFSWLRNHPNSYSLQGSIVFLILSVVMGLFKPQWRKWCWGTAGLAFLGLILSLLGGRTP